MSDKWTKEINLLIRMAEECDKRGDVQSPQGRWTYYQGKIDAYRHVLEMATETAPGAKEEAK